MSKRVAASVLALSIAAVAHPGIAQELGVGARIGPAFTTFGGDADPDSKTGFIVSSFFIYSVSELLGVYPELSYVRKGASSTRQEIDPGPLGTTLVTTLESTNDLDYVELQVPITLTIPARRTPVRARLYAGPSAALELNCSAELRVQTEEFSPAGTRLSVDSSTESGSCEDESILGAPLFTATKSLDFGLILGAGIDVGVGRGAITGDLRYDLGLTDIQDGTGGSIKNRAFEILLGYAHYFSG